MVQTVHGTNSPVTTVYMGIGNLRTANCEMANW